MRGPALLLAGIALFTLLDANTKLLSGSYGVGQTILLRHVGILALLLLARAAWPGVGGRLVTRRPWLHLARALCMVVSAGSFFLGFQDLPLAEGYLVFFTAPLFTLALAAVVLRERVPRAAWLWCAVGFAGVLLSVAPKLGAGAAPAAYLWVLLGTFSFALTQTINRSLRNEAGFALILFWPSVIGLVAYAPFAAVDWVAPPPVEAARLLLNGLFAGAAAVLTAIAYRYADAARLGPYGYAALPISMLLDRLVWGVDPDVWTLAGGVVVVVACLMSERARLQAIPSGKRWVPSGSSGSGTTARTAASGSGP